MWIDRRLALGVCAASLLLNVFLGGAVIGRAFGDRHRAAEPRAAANGALVTVAHVQALPPEDRRRFRDAMAPHRPAIRTARAAHRAARRQVEADLAAPVFDRAKVDADFATLKETNRNIDEVVDTALVDALAGLPAASRAALVSHARVAPPTNEPAR